MEFTAMPEAQLEIQWISFRVWMTFRVSLCLGALLISSFVFVALWTRRRRHVACAHLFVLNLAACALVGGLGDSLYLMSLLACKVMDLFNRERVLCQFHLLLFVFVYMTNVLALGLIALDRYVLIVHSLRYMLIVTERRALWLIAGTWMISACGALSVLLDDYWRPGVSCEKQEGLVPPWHLLGVQVPTYILVLAILTATHVRIRSEAWRSEKRHLSLSLKPQPQPGPEWVAFTAKTLRIVTTVVACYFIVFTPVQVVFLLELMSLGDAPMREQARFVSTHTFALCFLVNPFLYSWMNSHLRADLLATWRRLWGCCSRPRLHALHV